jgi:2-polyprenyl-3-methyl-5-hydroxy-6-metoxy-1,4-benzoquinol methylase
LQGPYDLIVAKDVIEHISDDVTFLKEASARLSRGGKLLLVTQNDYSLNYVLESPHEVAKDPSWMGWHPTEHK